MTTKETAPCTKLSPHTKCWWTKELTALCISRNKASTEHFKWCGLPNHPSHSEYKTINKLFARAIKSAKLNHWKEWIEQAKGTDIWTIHRYMKANPTDYGCQHIPNLKQTDGSLATTNEEKAKCLASTFFPQERPLNNWDHQFVKSNPPRAPESKFPVFTIKRVKDTLTKTNPFKAPGPSGISNAILKHCAPTLAPILAPIYTAICSLKHYPRKLGKIHQVILPKPGHATYEIASSYHPIALIKTIAKTLSTTITEDLSYKCEMHNLLPAHQFGGRPGRSTTDALHYIEQIIKNAWRKGQTISALLLDIQAAFPNMRKDRLLANMKARNIADKYCNYVDMILTQHQIQLKFDDQLSNPFSPENKCCQGCPLSMLLYAIYNTPLINIVNQNNKNEHIVGFVDDTTLIAVARNFDEMHKIIKHMMERKNGVFDWSKTFNSLFVKVCYFKPCPYEYEPECHR
jgi:hypothetical protein